MMKESKASTSILEPSNQFLFDFTIRRPLLNLGPYIPSIAAKAFQLDLSNQYDHSNKIPLNELEMEVSLSAKSLNSLLAKVSKLEILPAELNFSFQLELDACQQPSAEEVMFNNGEETDSKIYVEADFDRSLNLLKNNSDDKKTVIQTVLKPSLGILNEHLRNRFFCTQYMNGILKDNMNIKKPLSVDTFFEAKTPYLSATQRIFFKHKGELLYIRDKIDEKNECSKMIKLGNPLPNAGYSTYNPIISLLDYIKEVRYPIYKKTAFDLLCSVQSRYTVENLNPLKPSSGDESEREYFDDRQCSSVKITDDRHRDEDEGTASEPNLKVENADVFKGNPDRLEPERIEPNIKIFQAPAKLFVFDASKALKIKGEGQMKIWRRPATGHCYLLLFDKDSGKLLINMPVDGKWHIQYLPNSSDRSKICLWTYYNYANDRQGIRENLLCCFKDTSAVSHFKDVVSTCGI